MTVRNKLEGSDLLEMVSSGTDMEQEQEERENLLDQIRSLIISMGSSLRLEGECEDGEVEVDMPFFLEAIEESRTDDLRDFLKTRVIWHPDQVYIHLKG